MGFGAFNSPESRDESPEGKDLFHVMVIPSCSWVIGYRIDQDKLLKRGTRNP